MDETEVQQTNEELIWKILNEAQDTLNGGDKYWSGEFSIPEYRSGLIGIVKLCRNYLNSMTEKDKEGKRERG